MRKHEWLDFLLIFRCAFALFAPLNIKHIRYFNIFNFKKAQNRLAVAALNNVADLRVSYARWTKLRIKNFASGIYRKDRITL